MKGVVSLVIFMASYGIAKAQFMGHETPVEMPSMGVYNNSLQTMYIQGLRERAEYNNRMLEVLTPIFQKAYKLYYNNRYNDCDKFISDVLRTYTFYNGQELLYARLVYLKGMSHVKLGSLNSGISLLVLAKDDGDSEASSELYEIFYSCYNTAQECYQRADYLRCMEYINTALKTEVVNGDIYMLAGQTMEKLNELESAKYWYKLAKKHGSPRANEMLKELKIKQKELSKKNY